MDYKIRHASKINLLPLVRARLTSSNLYDKQSEPAAGCSFILP